MEMRILYECCPLCDSEFISKSLVGNCSKHLLYRPEIPSEMQWMDCSECKHQFINGYFTDEALSLIFQKTQEKQKVGYEIEKQRYISARMIEKVIPYVSSGSWLDVGFGNGSLIFTAEEYGFETIGVDLRLENVNAMKRLGFNAYCELVQNIEFEKPLSVVSMMDVLEHIPYPKEVLLSLHAKMVSGACLLVSMPNSENIIWKQMVAQNQSPYLGEIEHYHNFSRTRLYSLFDECGFEAVRYGISERYRACMEVLAVRK